MSDNMSKEITITIQAEQNQHAERQQKPAVPATIYDVQNAIHTLNESLLTNDGEVPIRIDTDKKAISLLSGVLMQDNKVAAIAHNLENAISERSNVIKKRAKVSRSTDYKRSINQELGTAPTVETELEHFNWAYSKLSNRAKNVLIGKMSPGAVAFVLDDLIQFHGVKLEEFAKSFSDDPREDSIIAAEVRRRMSTLNHPKDKPKNPSTKKRLGFGGSGARLGLAAGATFAPAVISQAFEDEGDIDVDIVGDTTSSGENDFTIDAPINLASITGDIGPFSLGPEIHASGGINDNQQGGDGEEGEPVEIAMAPINPTETPGPIHSVPSFRLNQDESDYLFEQSQLAMEANGLDPSTLDPNRYAYTIGLPTGDMSANLNLDQYSFGDGLLDDSIAAVWESSREIIAQNLEANPNLRAQLVVAIDNGEAVTAIKLVNGETTTLLIGNSNDGGQPLQLVVEEGQTELIIKTNSYLTEELNSRGYQISENQFIFTAYETLADGTKAIVSIASTGNEYYTLEVPIVIAEAAPTEQSVDQIIENARMFEINGEPVGFEMVGTLSSETIMSGTEYSFIMPVVTSRPYDMEITVNDRSGNPITIDARVVNMAIPINGENVEFIAIIGGDSLMPMMGTYDARAYLSEDRFVYQPNSMTRTHHMQFDSILNIGDQVKIQIWGATNTTTATNSWYQEIDGLANTFYNNAHLFADLVDDHNALIDAVDQQNANTYNNNANSPQRLIRVSTIGLNGSN